MLIAHVDIQNFRKLKLCRVEFAERETVFVGANNSGKTSAMDVLIAFLKKGSPLAATDFTLSNWPVIDRIAQLWVSSGFDAIAAKASLQPLLPTLDVWLKVEDSELHYVSHIIPTLNWQGGFLGVRLRFEPKDMEELYKSYNASREAARETVANRPSAGNGGPGRRPPLNLWPTSMRDFLARQMGNHFGIRAYILDPAKRTDEAPQELSEDAEPLEGDPFAALIKVDVIDAQRGFSDPHSAEASSQDRRLSAQLRHYFDKHLNPSELPDASDLEALEAIATAKDAFDSRLKDSFRSAIGELQALNYPGFSNPEITLSTRFSPIEGLNHESAVQFNVGREGGEPNAEPLALPEQYNGLGYQNLISMVFSLIRFRDEWMRVGKATKKVSEGEVFIEPLHLVLVEEPEAHLHAQVQQVFVKKAYSVLRSRPELGEAEHFRTQLVISTHSSHIAHEIDFTSLRYFRRVAPPDKLAVPFATVVNLTSTFGSDDDTARFATRYLKTTHCDLFFSDAAIVVEGPAERMLVPHFIRSHFEVLDKSYISLLEIGGSHAHRLRPLLEKLGIFTLIITDLDSIESSSTKKTRPQRGKMCRTRNDTLCTWIPGLQPLDELLDVSDQMKVAEDGGIRVAFPCEVRVDFVHGGQAEIGIPYTFEDGLALNNLALFRGLTGATGLLKKFADAARLATMDDALQSMFEALEGGKKAEMALELLYTNDPSQMLPPKYISEGLRWLSERLESGAQSIPETATLEGVANA